MAEPRTQTHCPWNIAAQVRFGLSIMNCPAVSPAARATDAHVSPGLTTWSPVQRTLTAGGSGARARPVVGAAGACSRCSRRRLGRGHDEKEYRRHDGPVVCRPCCHVRDVLCSLRRR